MYSAGELRANRFAPTAMAQRERRPRAICDVAVAPPHERDHGGRQFRARFRETILLARTAARFAIRRALQNATFDKLCQTRREHVARAAKRALQVVEAPQPQQSFSQYEQRPTPTISSVRMSEQLSALYASRSFIRPA